MFDVCLHGVREVTEKLKTFMTSSMGIFLYTAAAGVVGIVILLAFFSMVVPASSLHLFLPFIIAFNAAAGGYGLVEKQEGQHPFDKLSFISLAVLFTLTGCGVVTLLCPWQQLTQGGSMLISAISAPIFLYFGIWLSRKNKKLNKQS